MSFDAWKAFENVKDNYCNFLKEQVFGKMPTNQMGEYWNRASAQLDRWWKDPKNGLFAEPLVEFMFSYKKHQDQNGKDLNFADICASQDQDSPTIQKPFHRSMRDLLVNNGMADWSVLSHQAKAFEKTIGENPKSIVVSSGTGSGKTECFLLPMLNRMLWNETPQQLQEPGVRVLLIYPMNALVNNQLDRILRLLDGNNSHIRVGCYNGKTPGDLTQNLAANWPEDKQRFIGERREKIWNGVYSPDRYTIRHHPPHILITNYSMLEYMLLRRDDEGVFLSQKLQTIILDEAHLYGGSLGTEIAMLLRRVMSKFEANNENVLGIATSATLGNTEDSAERLCQFAASLFNKELEQVEVISGEKVLPEENPEQENNFESTIRWEDIDQKELKELSKIQTLGANNGFIEFSNKAIARRVYILKKWGICSEDYETNITTPAKVLHEIFSRNNTLVNLRKRIFNTETPLKWSSLAEVINIDNNCHSSYAVSVLLSLMGKACVSPDDPPFLANKLHTFVRRPGTVYSDLEIDEDHPLGNLYEESEIDDLPLFDLNVPRKKSDGMVYFRGYVTHVDTEIDQEFRIWPDNHQGGHYCVFRLAMANDEANAKFNIIREQDSWQPEQSEEGDFVFAMKEPSTLDEFANGWRAEWRTISGKGLVDRDPDPDADYEDKLIPLGRIGEELTNTILIEGIWPFLSALPLEKRDNVASEGRTMIAFSDTRRNASWLGSNLQISRRTQILRKIIFRFLNNLPDPVEQRIQNAEREFGPLTEVQIARIHEQNANAIPNISMNKLAQRILDDRHCCKEIATLFDYENWYDGDYAFQGIGELLRAEFTGGVTGGATLESLAMARVDYDGLLDCPDQYWYLPNFVPDEMIRNFLVNENFRGNWKTLIRYILDRMRGNRAVHRENNNNEPDFIKDFRGKSYGNQRYVLEYKNNDNNRNIKQLERFLPAEERYAARSQIYNYVKEILRRAHEAENVDDYTATYGQITNMLRLIYHYLQQQNNLIHVQNDDEISIEPRAIRIAGFQSDKNIQYCDQLNAYRYRLPGETDVTWLEGIEWRVLTNVELDTYQENRYWQFYTGEEEILGIRSHEHTAQIDAERLERIESNFRNGMMNMLSCSTTMEVGIDLGGLTCVFMTNLPPTPSNYIQRAGRAGRRNDGSSLLLTALRNTPYDLEVKDNSRVLYDKAIEVPMIRLDWPRVVYRHANAFLLSRFFAQLEDDNVPSSRCGWFYGTNNAFNGFTNPDLEQFDEDDYVAYIHNSPYRQFIDYLNNFAQEDRDLLETILPANFDIDSIIDSLKRKLQLSQQTHIDDFRQIYQQYYDAKYNDRNAEADCIKYSINQILGELLIQHLSNNLVIPKYGFPTDLVPLYTNTNNYNNNNVDNRQESNYTDLTRNARIAISEYSPGSNIVVGGKVCQSRGLTKNIYDPNQPWEVRYFIVCNQCESFQETNAPIQQCGVCGHPTVFDGNAVGGNPMKNIRDANKFIKDTLDNDNNDLNATLVHSYIRPKAFRVDFNEVAKPASILNKKPSSTMARSHVVIREQNLIFEKLQDSLEVAYLPEAEIMHINAGKSYRGNAHGLLGYGYNLCLNCGYAILSDDYMEDEGRIDAHRRIYGPGDCQCRNVWRNVYIGAKTTSDILVYRIKTERFNNNMPEGANEKQILNTLMAGLIKAASNRLHIEESDISGDIRARYEDGVLTHREIILYDSTSGDAGYIQDINVQNLERQLWLDLAGVDGNKGILKCPHAMEDDNGHCKTACSRCLRSYRNTWMESSGKLHRANTRQWLETNSRYILGDLPENNGMPVRLLDYFDMLFDGQCDTDIYIPEFSINNSMELIDKLTELRNNNIKRNTSSRVLLGLNNLDGIDHENLHNLAGNLGRISGRENRIEVKLSGDDNQDNTGASWLVKRANAWYLYYGKDEQLKSPCQRLMNNEDNIRYSGYFDTLWQNASGMETLPSDRDNGQRDLSMITCDGGKEAGRGYMWDKIKKCIGRSEQRIRKLIYIDRYFKSIVNLRNLLDILEPMPRTQNFECMVVGKEIEYNCRYKPLQGHMAGCRFQLEFTENDMQTVKDYMAEKLQLGNEDLRLYRHRWLNSNPLNKHYRIIICYYENGKDGFTVRFDQGMDWAEPRDHTDRRIPILDQRRAYVLKDTHVVIRNYLSENELNAWNVYSDVEVKKI